VPSGRRFPLAFLHAVGGEEAAVAGLQVAVLNPVGALLENAEKHVRHRAHFADGVGAEEEGGRGWPALMI